MKKIISILLALCLLTGSALAMTDEEAAELDGAEVDASVFEDGEIPVTASGIEIPAPSAILIEKETGTVIYEKNADQQLEPASVTKVMTILLIVEAVESGAISLEDTVTVSKSAAEMGGSQVFLEEGEQMQVKEMLKCIVVSSANDAAVAMAEHIAGTESAFVEKMNARAAELGMTGTAFFNCTGLPGNSGHVTTARDITLMARELLCHDWIKEYTTIWMDTIRDGTFGLSNTNKLVRYYDGATGLKTGFTASAGYCLAASAERDGVEYIVGIMHCETSADRFESAKALLSYGFANYTLLDLETDRALAPLPVELGARDTVQPVLKEQGKILIEKTKAAAVEKTVELPESIPAPVEAGQTLGKLMIKSGEEILKEIPIVAGDAVPRRTWTQEFLRLFNILFFGG